MASSQESHIVFATIKHTAMDTGKTNPQSTNKTDNQIVGHTVNTSSESKHTWSFVQHLYSDTANASRFAGVVLMHRHEQSRRGEVCRKLV